MDGEYVGCLSADDPLHDFLGRILRDQLQLGHRTPKYRVFRLGGSHEVYGYHDKYSRARIICKFYGSRFRSDPSLGAIAAAQKESDNLDILRGYGLVGSPHHVVRPLGVRPDINGVLAVEYYSGETLRSAIRRATRHHDDAHLFWRLKALAYFLATQHDRTANGSNIDFNVECDYFDAIVNRLFETGRIGQWDVEELSWLRDLWRGRARMWQDRQVWLHGDATPGNFLFGTRMHVGAIDLESMRRGDRVFDIGRMAADLQHAFMITTGRKSSAEPFIRQLYHEYSSHFPDPGVAIESITARAPFYVGLNLIRKARNDYISQRYRERLVRQAKRLLRAN
jgi:aminoglycoside phosphotransferase (APT) family kinase protein